MNSFYLDAIRKFEGFTPQAQWDYAQYSNGYGTRALYAGEVIDRAEADRRFQAEIAGARTIVERHAPNADEGTKAALTSLTFNAGDKWTRSGLGDAVRRGDLDAVRELFQEYNKAGGKELPGLVDRRTIEARWIGSPQTTVAEAGNGFLPTRVANVTPSFQPAVSSVQPDNGHVPALRDAVAAMDRPRTDAGVGIPGDVARGADDATSQAAVSLLRQLLGDTLVDRTVLGSARLDRGGNVRQDRWLDEKREEERGRREGRIERA